MRKAHARQNDAAQAEEGQNEQRDFDPRVGGVDVFGDLCFWRASKRLQPHSGHVETGHRRTEQDAHRWIDEARVIKGNAPRVGDDAFLRPETTDEREPHDGQRTDQHRRGRKRHF